MNIVKKIILGVTLLLSQLFSVAQNNCEQLLLGVSTAAHPASGAGPAQALFRINPSTGAMTFIVNLYGGSSPAANDGGRQETSAIAYDPTTSRLYFVNRGMVTTTSIPHKLHWYNIATGVFSTEAQEVEIPRIGSINKAAYNPADGKIWLHDDANTLYRYTPGSTSVSNLGGLYFPGSTNADLSGGDLVFDGLGNLTSVFYRSEAPATGRVVFFPAYYTGNQYEGFWSEGSVLAEDPNHAAIAGVAFMPSGGNFDGQYVTGYSTTTPNPLRVVDVLTGEMIHNFSHASLLNTTDLASCSFPKPVIDNGNPALSLFKKEGTIVCGSPSTITLTYNMENSGDYLANNAKLFDTIPTGYTVASIAINGNNFGGTATSRRTALINGLSINSPGDNAGIIRAGGIANVVVTITTTLPVAQLSTRGWVTYDGIQTTGVSQISSNDPNTSTPNDPTTVTCLRIGGTVYNDPNGLNGTPVNTIDGTGTNAGGSLYANLLDNTGKVIRSMSIPANGQFSFVNLLAGDYRIQVSTTQGVEGAVAPAATLPAGWAKTAENIGNIGTDATLDGVVNVSLSTAAVNNLAFGIEREPQSYAVNTTITGKPVMNQAVALSTLVLRGSDVDDQPAQGPWTNKSLAITSMPTEGFVLTYDGHTITLTDIGTTGYIINNYDPAKLSITPVTTAGGISSTSFQYAVIDAAGVRDPSPAIATVNYTQALPVVFGSVTAVLKEGMVLVNWESLKETNNSHFEIQGSVNGYDFVKIGQVQSTAPDGNSDTAIAYEFTTSAASSGILAGVSVLALALGLGFRNRKLRVSMLLVVGLGLTATFSACSKNGSDVLDGKNADIFIRVVQVDKDGTQSYSRVVKVVKK